ncbi:hypothetical protein [Hymenobacter fodinae]|uniref:Uncharacterized protein n=1 Tax=Hymenobacter fodinae TaxID=2510796 RepID=A0A4Z0PCX8_9BACT|nr:hypothetical protein [Hymenobacter fodinae]TGE10058.1 hypothetical protein EU556_04345 [Hymenobacter fodinae]
MHTRAYLLTSALFLTGLAATAQQRLDRSAVFQPELQAELTLKNNDYLFLGLSALNTNGVGTAFSGGQLRLGYEHFWSEQWSGGATLRLQRQYRQGYGDFLGQPGNVIPGVFVRHLGKIGAFNVGQRLGIEYAVSTPKGYFANQDDRALARLRLDVDRLFPLSETVALRPRVAYEAAAYLRFQRDENQLKERTIDFGALRAEVGVRLSPHVDITPWFAYQTVYAVFVPQYDAITGKQISGGRTNIVTPVIGLDARFTLFSDNTAQERRQLPTQH